jgi:hypothetical protein
MYPITTTATALMAADFPALVIVRPPLASELQRQLLSSVKQTAISSFMLGVPTPSVGALYLTKPGPLAQT